jgi:hypothetical protein
MKSEKVRVKAKRQVAAGVPGQQARMIASTGLAVSGIIPRRSAASTAAIARRGHILRSVGRDILSGTIAGVFSGVAILVASLFATQALEQRLIDQQNRLEDLRSDQQNRVEDLRYVRDISTRASGPMPFRNLDLEGMNLSGLRLGCRDPQTLEGECRDKADFVGAKLTSANMSRMDLGYADFTGADLRNANLSQSNLRRANLIDADMTGANLDQACYDELTRWPEGFSAPKDKYGDGEVCNPGL